MGHVVVYLLDCSGLVPILAFAVLGGIGAITGSSNAAAAGLIVATLVSGVLFIGLTYIYPAALTNFARTGSVEKAFAFGEISDVVTSGDYFMAWLLGFVIFVGGFIVVGILSIIPILGTIVGLFVNFYIQVAAYRVFGTAFREALEGTSTSVSTGSSLGTTDSVHRSGDDGVGRQITQSLVVVADKDDDGTDEVGKREGVDEPEQIPDHRVIQFAVLAGFGHDDQPQQLLAERLTVRRLHVGEVGERQHRTHHARNPGRADRVPANDPSETADNDADQDGVDDDGADAAPERLCVGSGLV